MSQRTCFNHRTRVICLRLDLPQVVSLCAEILTEPRRSREENDEVTKTDFAFPRREKFLNQSRQEGFFIPSKEQAWEKQNLQGINISFSFVIPAFSLPF